MKKITSKDALSILALKVMNLTKTEIQLALPYLGSALDALGFVPDFHTRTIGCDGEYIRYNPNYIIDTFLNRTDILRRTYMQIVMHCIFCHIYRQSTYDDKELYSLCADISAESVIDGIDNPTIYRLSSDYRDSVYEKLYSKVEVLTPDRLYRYFCSKDRDYVEEDRLLSEFALDDHSFWKLPDKKNQASQSLQNEKQWQNTAKRIKDDLNHASSPGDAKGSLERLLRATYKSKTDYKKLLEKYSIVREEMKIDPDTFDYGLYMYGLSLYENMPLIEENEYSELKAVDELVIAIDTSASCQAEHVQKFLNETASMLSKAESFFKHTDIVIIECDNQVQKTIHLNTPNKIHDYADEFIVKGGFGTDFRPVFLEVENMQKRGLLSHLKGLLYFTDGMGVYPDTPTAYETSFILWKERAHDEGLIPPWAQVLYFDEY